MEFLSSGMNREVIKKQLNPYTIAVLEEATNSTVQISWWLILKPSLVYVALETAELSNNITNRINLPTIGCDTFVKSSVPGDFPARLSAKYKIAG